MNIELLYEASDHNGHCTSDECTYQAKKYIVTIHKHYINKIYHKYFLLSDILPYDIINVIMHIRVEFESINYDPFRKVKLHHLTLYKKMYIMFELDLADKNAVERFMFSNFKQKVNTKGTFYCLLCSSSKLHDLSKHDYRLTFY